MEATLRAHSTRTPKAILNIGDMTEKVTVVRTSTNDQTIVIFHSFQVSATSPSELS